MSILDKLDKGDSIGIEWIVVEDDQVRLGLLRLNSNQLRARKLKGFKMPWSWKCMLFFLNTKFGAKQFSELENNFKEEHKVTSICFSFVFLHILFHNLFFFFFHHIRQENKVFLTGKIGLKVPQMTLVRLDQGAILNKLFSIGPL